MARVQALPWVYRNQLDRLRPGYTVQANTDKTSRLALILSAGSHEELQRRMERVQNLLQVQVETEDGIQGLIWA